MSTPTHLLEKGISAPIFDLSMPVTSREDYLRQLQDYIGILEKEYTNLDTILDTYHREQHDKAQAIQTSILKLEFKQSALTQKLESLKKIAFDEGKTPDQKLVAIQFLLGG